MFLVSPSSNAGEPTNKPVPPACPKLTTKPMPVAFPVVGVDGVVVAPDTGTKGGYDGSSGRLTPYEWDIVAVVGASVFTLLVYLLFDHSRWAEVAADDEDLESMGRADNEKENGGGGVETSLAHRGRENGPGSAAAG